MLCIIYNIGLYIGICKYILYIYIYIYIYISTHTVEGYVKQPKYL